MRYDKPCRMLILAKFLSGGTKRIRLSNANYDWERHADRWLERGAHQVFVTLWSKSTGREVLFSVKSINDY